MAWDNYPGARKGMRIAGGMTDLEKTREVLLDTSTRTSDKSFKLNTKNHYSSLFFWKASPSTGLSFLVNAPSSAQTRIMGIIWTPPSLSFAVIQLPNHG